MTDFSIPEGKNTPRVTFLANQEKLSLKGKSFPENARKFYDDLGTTFKPHTFSGKFSVEIDLDYMSSSSVICVLDLIKRLKTQSPSTKFSVSFFHDEGDDDMMAVGENYQKILGEGVTLIKK